MEKPDVDFIEGLSPAISIDQKSTSRNPRSTVGHDHRGLRLPAGALRARRSSALPQLRPPDRAPDPGPDRRPGHGASRGHEVPGARAGRARPQGGVREAPRGSRPQGVPAGADRRGGARARRADPAAEDLQAHDRGRRRPARRQARDPPARGRLHRDRPGARGRDRLDRRADARRPRGAADLLAGTSPARHCGLSFDELAPRNFSFNSPYGACTTCDGLGTRLEVDPELVVPDADLSVREGALAPWASATLEYWNRVLEAVAEAQDITLDTPWRKLPEARPRGPALRLRSAGAT